MPTRREIFGLFACILLALTPATSNADPEEIYAGDLISRVIDGGTIEISLPDRMQGQPFTVVRLWGIDCPRPAGRERYAQEHAGAARDLTRALAAGRSVLLTLETHRTRGPLGQVLAHVRLAGGTNLNERILAEGLARTDERWPHAQLTRYAQIQRAARRSGMGIWK